jgi:hypothetical protein
MRDNLALVQHTTKELSQAIEDFVAACSSSRNANMLPAMLRAQTAAASLTSMLDVLSRVLTASLQPARTGAADSYVATLAAAEPPAAVPEAPPPAPAAPQPTAPPRPVVLETPAAVAAPVPPPVAPQPPPAPPVERTGTVLMASAVEIAPAAPAEPRIFEHGIPVEQREPALEPAAAPLESIWQQEAVAETLVEIEPEPAPVTVEPPPAPAPELPVAAPPPAPAFRVEDLPPEQQELHRRANRHAKVSMQDIYLLRPKDVQLGRQNHDICTRLKGDIEKARKEYVRRFGPILEHPVDYFHHWMVEVLAEGKPEVLGEYPYPSAIHHQ